jgi:iron complex outermembrane receptor protein
MVDVDPTTLRPLYGKLTQKRFTDELSSASWKWATSPSTASSATSSWCPRPRCRTSMPRRERTAASATAWRWAPPSASRTWASPRPNSPHPPRVAGTAPALDRLRRRLGYEGGLYYTNEDSGNRIPGFRPFSTTTGADYPLPSIVKASIDSSYKEYSVFANANYAITPQFDVLAGIRHGRDEQVYAQDYSGLLVGPTPVIFDSGSKESKTTYLASARYKPSATDALYARVATGFRPGGPNAVPPTSATLAPLTFAAGHPHQL